MQKSGQSHTGCSPRSWSAHSAAGVEPETASSPGSFFLTGPVGTLALSRTFHMLLIVLLGSIAYSNSLHGPFLFDDSPSIVGNPVIREAGNFFLNATGYQYNPNRYVCNLSFALNYLAGGLEVTGYHLFNLAVHLINSLLVYALVLVTFRTPFFNDSRAGTRFSAGTSPFATASYGVALLAALIFAVHPLQTQAVSYIVQRFASLVTLFFLLALVLYAWMREAGESLRLKAFLLYVASLASVLLAMKTKENAFTLPAVICLYEWLFFRGAVKKRLLRLVPFFLTMLVIPLTMLDIHKPVGAIISQVSQVSQHKAPLSRLDYLYTQFRVVVTYLRLLVFPVNQNLDYDYPLYHTIFAASVFASFLLLLALVGVGFYLCHRSRTQLPELRLAAFGIFYFFITLSVESSIIPITDVIYEHRVYLSSVGVFLAAATLLVSLSVRVMGEAGRKAVFCSCIVAIALLCVATYQRNKVWGSTVSLWEDVVRKSPLKARGYNSLGAAYSEAERREEAIISLKRSLALDPAQPEAYYNLGGVYLTYPGRSGDAIDVLKTAIAIRPDYDDAYVDLAAALIQAGNPAESARILESIMARVAQRPDAHMNLAIAYFMLGNVPQALTQAKILRELDPRMAGQLENYMKQSRTPVEQRG